MSPVAPFDHVIVGAGSAGCVLAARLSEDPARRVLLVEAGPADRSWTIQMPAALTWNLMHDRYNWAYRTEPQAELDQRRLYWPRGRVLGGSSSLNAMVYIRGHPLDYERWQGEGAEGWGWAEVLPYFKKAESFSLGADPWRGGTGPLAVTRGASPNPLYEAFLEAGEQAGYGRTRDLNGWRQEGFGRMDMTIQAGRRCSAARAYLHPARGRPNLTVMTRALVTKIRVAHGRAVGVDLVENHVAKRIDAAEVILCGGAVNSPQLLMLSGIGPADHLRGHGIRVVHDLPGVGANLQDHLELYVQVRCKEPHSLLPVMRGLGQVATGLEWFLFGTGPGASSHLEAGAFIRSAAGIEHPDIQYHFLPALIDDHGRAKGRFHAYQVHVGPMRPAARGTIRLRSADPRAHPVIEPNYLAEPRDRAEMRACVTLTREIFAQPAFAAFRDGELRPGEAVRTRAEIDSFVRQRADSAYHPCCTCAMGPPGAAVVDAQGRVHGLSGLRVVDASIMPSMVSGNLNAPVIMIAEKLADAIRGRPPLPPEPAAFWVDPHWRTRQREHPPGGDPAVPHDNDPRRLPCVT